MKQLDLVVPGGGTAGLVAAIGAASIGALVERERNGGECLWTGCVPSKSLLAAAQLAHRMRNAGDVGLAPLDPEAFARLSSHVTIVARDAQLLGREEPEASELLTRRLQAEGIDQRLGWSAKGAAAGELEIERDDERAVVAFDRVLVATGRRPRTEKLNLGSAGVQLTQDGAVQTDERLQTSAPGVFAAGDVTGAPPFTHVAAHHARVVVTVTNALLHTRRSVEERAVPRVTYTDPEAAAVGLGERDARERYGHRVTATRFDWGFLDRAITDGVADGFAKLIGDRRGRLVGATVAAPAAGDAIAELTPALRRKARIDEISQTIHAYPTLAEGPARAADEHMRAKHFNDRVRRLLWPVLTILRASERPR